VRVFTGTFPLWLAPEQVRVLTLNDDEKLVAYAKEIHHELRAIEVRAEADFSSEDAAAPSPHAGPTHECFIDFLIELRH
jgi:threonyl-tRNA synthetase